MITPYQLLQEAGFAQYTAMIRVRYNRDNTSLGAEKIAEMIRAIPGATRVSTVSLDKEHGIGIFNAKIISQKPAKEAYQALKQNALERYAGLVTGLDVGANTIEVKGDFILKENKKPKSNLSKVIGQLLEEGLLLEVSIDELRRQWVDSGKMDEKVFNTIVQAVDNQSNYATWLCKKVGEKIINLDNIEDWGRRLAFFDEYKSRFKTKDINSLKTAEQLQSWIDNEFIPTEKEVFKKQMAGGSRVDEKLHGRLSDLRVKDFDSKLTGKKYYVFRLGRQDFDVEHYLGNGTQWCTRNSKGTFLRYLNGRDVSGCEPAYWIFVNKTNTSEKWQLLVKAGYFCDKNDHNFLYDRKAVPVEMLKHIRDKEGQQVGNTRSVGENIRWLENKMNNKNRDEGPAINVDDYLLGTESSYKLYRFAHQAKENCKLLMQLGIAKSLDHAEAILDEFVSNPLAIIVNTGNKKAEPLYVGSWTSSRTGRITLCQADDRSSFFSNLKNENEYKLLVAFAESQGFYISPYLTALWDKDKPDLKSFRFNNRDDVWKFTSSNNTDRALTQLTVLAMKGVGNSDEYWFDRYLSMFQDYLQSIPECYFMTNGHNTGVFVPPGARGNASEETDFSFISSTGISAQVSARIPIYLKAQRVQIPMRFSEDTRTHSYLGLAKFTVDHSTLESIKQFKVSPSNARANRLWEFYKNSELAQSLNDRSSNTGVVVRSPGSETYLLVDSRAYVYKCRFEEGIGLVKDDYPVGKISEALNLIGINTLRRSAFEETQVKVNAFVEALGEFGIYVSRNRGWQRILAKFGRFSRNSETGDTTGTTGNAAGTPRTVTEFMEDHEEELGPVTIPCTRRVTVQSPRGIRVPWEGPDNAAALLSIRTPGIVRWVQNALGGEEHVLDAVFYVRSEHEDVTAWCAVIRCVNSQNQVVRMLVKTAPGNQGEGWRWSVPSARNMITVDNQGNAVETTPPARQPRQAQAQTAAPGGEAFAQAGNVDQESAQEFAIEATNTPHAYSTDAEHSQDLLNDFGFTALSNALQARPDLRRNVVVYQTYPHRGTTQWVAILYGNNQPTIVAGYPQNPSWIAATTDSQQWRRLTHQLDNSVRTFQQCHDICQELHIVLPVAIQGWLIYRGQ